jgi:hypothetical protein
MDIFNITAGLILVQDVDIIPRKLNRQRMYQFTC